MKNIIILFYLIMLFVSCGNDCGEHFLYDVKFYSNHENYELIAAVFETVTEQVLVKEAHFSEGATFETLTEQVLIQDAYTYRKIADSLNIVIVNDAELNKIQEIECYYFYAKNEFIEEIIPAHYGTRNYQRATNLGTGNEVPAVYETRSYKRLVSDSELILHDGVRKYNRVSFNIPKELSIKAYFEDQLNQRSIINCIEGNSYDYF